MFQAILENFQCIHLLFEFDIFLLQIFKPLGYALNRLRIVSDYADFILSLLFNDVKISDGACSIFHPSLGCTHRLSDVRECSGRADAIDTKFVTKPNETKRNALASTIHSPKTNVRHRLLLPYQLYTKT